MLVSRDVVAKSYRQMAVSQQDMSTDKQRLNRLNKYVMSVESEYEKRLLLNQLIVLFNTFKFGWACFLLEVHAKNGQSLGRFYAIMFALGFDTAGCDVDSDFLETFRGILDEHPTQKEILSDFRRGSWW